MTPDKNYPLTVALQAKSEGKYVPGLVDYIYRNFEKVKAFRVDVGHSYTNRHRYVCTYVVVPFRGKNIPITYEGDDPKAIRSDWRELIKNASPK